jgi:hypothetical protein
MTPELFKIRTSRATEILNSCSVSVLDYLCEGTVASPKPCCHVARAFNLCVLLSHHNTTCNGILKMMNCSIYYLGSKIMGLLLLLIIK